ncbi:PAS domain S-box protein [Halococcus agarilyticus]|uniref:PAS domain S-box protein n=1 Tax=Halococcus agarilyticus TaxID=1232219 RepID=UPI000677C15D|nr:PAS domain S-box protein [Halococcus agarilyticus]
MEATATVLLVDDEPGVAETAAAFVERANGSLTTTTATNPTAALDRFEENGIDCVVSDYDMPGMDGLALFEAVAERDTETPFILFTGKGSEEVASEAISLGVTDYLQKETGTEQYEVLANRIENAVAARRATERLDRYETMIESVDDGLYTVDAEGRFTAVNDSFVALTGYDRSSLVGNDVSVLKDDETVERFEECVRRMLRDDRNEAYVEFDLRTAAGEVIPCEDHLVLQTDAGEYAGVAGVVRDVSGRERREPDHERDRGG